MGGLSKGEVASTTLISAFDDWVYNELPLLCNSPIDDAVIRSQWERIVVEQNKKIGAYGASQGIRLGTTIVVALFTQTRYYILNIGDSRAYEISDEFIQITNDQTFVAREVAMGRMTPEEALVSPQRNILLQCIGVTASVVPDFFTGEFENDTSFMICSDGFRHLVTPQEILNEFRPRSVGDGMDMKRRIRNLIELNKIRMEADNITALLVKAVN
jgi:serine/threonine protein phosphatase PrpC